MFYVKTAYFFVKFGSLHRKLHFLIFFNTKAPLAVYHFVALDKGYQYIQKSIQYHHFHIWYDDVIFAFKLTIYGNWWRHLSKYGNIRDRIFLPTSIVLDETYMVIYMLTMFRALYGILFKFLHHFVFFTARGQWKKIREKKNNSHIYIYIYIYTYMYI